tara:strand:- start:460 stop:780 length:321 start_codon:yes stop_codon:yes gene_type:complete
VIARALYLAVESLVGRYPPQPADADCGDGAADHGGDPNHLLLCATRRDAAGGLTDVGRLGEMLGRVRGHIEWRRLDQLLWEVAAEDADSLIAEAMAADANQAAPDV